MKRISSIFLVAVMCIMMTISATLSASATFNQEAVPKEGDTVAIIHTNYGDIAMNFFEKYAPKGVENFQTLAKDGKYDNTIFHRVIDGFMIQGGDYTNFDGTGGESCWGTEFENECVDELSNIRGSVSYANAGPDTNSSQFFINSVDNSASLDNGYTVFGQVFSGMDVVDTISKCEKQLSSSGEQSYPVNEVKVESVEITEYQKNMESSLAKATDPYEGVEGTTAVENTTANENTSTEKTDEESFNFIPIIFIPIIIFVGVLVVIFACFAIPYAISDRKKKKEKAERIAAQKANPDYKKKKSKKKR